MNSEFLEDALQVLGQLLSDRGQKYEVVAVGGGGLLLLGMIMRPTKDLDLIALIDQGKMVSARLLPGPLLKAIREVSVVKELSENWINAGPAGLFEMGLPHGFINRMHTFHYGGLTIHLAGRFDQICFKLYAAADHEPENKHFVDLKSLKPTAAELEEAKCWCLTHDVSEGFFFVIEEVIEVLKK